MNLSVTLKSGTESGQGAGAGAEPRRPGRAAAARRGPPAGHYGEEAVAGFLLVVNLISPDRSSGPALPVELRDAQRQDELARVEGSGDVIGLGPANTPCGSGWTRNSRFAASPPAKFMSALRAQNLQVAGGALGQPPSVTGYGCLPQLSLQLKGRLLRAPASLRNINWVLRKPGKADRRSCGSRTWAA